MKTQILILLAGVAAVALAPELQAQACCKIQAANPKTGSVTATVTGTGQVFQFSAAPGLAAALRPGQDVWANFRTGEVSLDGKRACCRIASAPSSAAPPAAPKPPANSQGGGSGGSRGPAVTVSLTNSLNTTALNNAVNPCDTHPSGVDLKALGVSAKSNTEVDVQVINCGTTATPAPFDVDVYVNGVQVITRQFGGLAAGKNATEAATVPEMDCKPTGVQVVVDPQQLVNDVNRNNNQLQRQSTPPCPDLVVTDIKQHWINDWHTQWEVGYTIVNQGSAPMSHSVSVRGWGGPVGVAGVFEFPLMLETVLDPLAPGQSKSNVITGQWFTPLDTVMVKLLADSDHTLKEPNKDNNYAEKTLGPH